MSALGLGLGLGLGTVTHSNCNSHVNVTYIADNFHQNDEQFSLSGNG